METSMQIILQAPLLLSSHCSEYLSSD